MENQLKGRIIQIGMGNGQGEIVDALPRQEIEDIIERLDVTDCYKLAYEKYIPGFMDGICYIDLEDGKVGAFAMQYNNSHQACDNNYIELVRVSQNEEDPYEVEYCQMEDFVKENINNFPDLPDNWNIEDVSDIYPYLWKEIHDELHLDNELAWQIDENFDWDYIEEELDARYNLDE